MHVGRRLVYTHRKYNVIFNDPPDLRKFPFDTQQLKMVMELKDKRFVRVSSFSVPFPRG